MASNYVILWSAFDNKTMGLIQQLPLLKLLNIVPSELA